jgi:hypothetical protein
MDFNPNRKSYSEKIEEAKAELKKLVSHTISYLMEDRKIFITILVILSVGAFAMIRGLYKIIFP